MNAQVASYYRAVLFADGQDSRPLPKSLMRLHMFTEQRHQALGLGSTISKAVALSVCLTWLSGTQEGRKFTKTQTSLKDLFTEEAEEESESGDDESTTEQPASSHMDKIKAGTPVVIDDDGKSIRGTFIEKRGSWIVCQVDSKERSFRTHTVKVEGA